jgi:hypothetical protein
MLSSSGRPHRAEIVRHDGQLPALLTADNNIQCQIDRKVIWPACGSHDLKELGRFNDQRIASESGGVGRRRLFGHQTGGEFTPRLLNIASYFSRGNHRPSNGATTGALGIFSSLAKFWGD